MAESGPRRFASGRHAGIVVPLFSIPSRASWGVGEIPDLVPLVRWLEAAGLDCVQLLPVNEMQEGQSSPYSALSAMAIDPIFISTGAVEECAGEAALAPGERRLLDAARSAPRIDHAAVRAAKTHALRDAFETFRQRHWNSGSARDVEFRRFRERERWWLEDYALFRALHDENDARYWLEWESGVRRREPAALDAARERLAPTVLYYEYLQWLAGEQWQRVRNECGRVGILGDFPFMVSGNSADVWARQHEFRVDASVGVPPDAFSETGQDWGLPVYRWDVIERTGYEWLRQRAARCAELYDGFRIDHLVGFYRTFVRERDGTTYFVPPDEPSQEEQGERLMRLFAESNTRIIAEDLGTVPEFVRESLAKLKIPGLKVLRWERDWKSAGRPFRDPAAYPADSVAMSGTHDTETVAQWWDEADAEERRAVLEVAALRDAGIESDEPFSDRLRDAVLETLFASRAELLLVPIQDVFGWQDRINTPGSTQEDNWTFRLPWPVEDLVSEAPAVERARFLRALSQRYQRCG